jgi:chromosome segregation protein
MFRLEKLEINGFKSFADRTTLVFGEGITGVVGPNGCGKCLSGDTLVTLADGRDVPIRDLVERALTDSGSVETLDDGSLTRQNPQGVEILSLNPATLRLEARPVAAFIKRTATPHLLRIRTRSGREVTATPYHPLFTLEHGRLRTLKAEEVRAGVRLALPRRLPVSGVEASLSPVEALKRFQADDNIFIPNSEALQQWAKKSRNRFGTWTGWTRAASLSAGQIKGFLGNQAISAATLLSLADVAESLPPLDGRIKSQGSGKINLPLGFTPDLARFLGLLIAEGRNTSSNQVWFVNSDPAINDEYERLARKLFEVEVRRLHYKPNAEDGLIFSRALCKALERLFNFPVNSISAEKQAPSQLFESDDETQWAFLSGLFEGDAYISAPSVDANRKPPYIEYVTASRRLAHQVVALLLRLGVFALLRTRQKYASNTTEKRRHDYYSVLIYGADKLRFVAGHLSFVGEKRKHLEALRNLRVASNPNYDLVPGVRALVKEAARVAGVKIKNTRRDHPKLAAYTEGRCEASRGGLVEIVELIERVGAMPEKARTHLDQLSVLATSDVYWDEIVGVEQISPPDPWVYDLSVADTHNFVAGNIIVHNSNVAEAISWVLGEQSAKSLRGGKMEDVIFNGTRDRKPTGMAEVVLTMVAIEDIAEHEHDTAPKDDESEYDEAVSAADRAAETARELVKQYTQDSSERDSQTAQTAEIPTTEIPTTEIPTTEIPTTDTAQANPTAEINQASVDESQPSGAHLCLTDSAADTAAGTIQTEPPPPDRARAYRRRKRQRIAISAGERISVGRRLYRTGDSDYLLNGRPCLLRDIQDLFAGTGLGGTHYAIIEQGRIGQILSSKPLDRRALIEEAAGITKFKSRKRSAELKLESAKQNLTRLNDIISEVERQVNSLKRQAQKARRFRRLRDEMRNLQKLVFTADYHRLNALAERVAIDLEEAEIKQGEIDHMLAEREAEYKMVSGQSREAEDHLAALREQAATVELETDRASNRRSFDEQQIQELEARIEELKGDQQALDSRLEIIDREAEQRAEDLRSLEAELTAEQADLLDRESLYQTEVARLRQAEDSIEHLRQRLLTEIGITERLKNLIVGLEDSLRRVGLKQSNLLAEMERACARRDEALGHYTRVGGEVQADLARLTDLGQAIAERAASLEAIGKEATEIRSQLEVVHAERTASDHRLASLEDLDAHHAYYSDAVQHVLSPEQAARINALGTLADFVEVEPQYERLIESLFGRELQCVLVPTIDDALAGVDSLKAEELGRGAFLVVGLHGGEGDPEKDEGGRRKAEEDASTDSDSSFILHPSSFILRLPSDTGDESPQRFELEVLRSIDLLGLRPEIKTVVERAFPEKCAAAVVPDIEAALQLSIENPSRVYVTMDGEQVVNGRLIVTGAQAGKKGTSLLGLKREIKQLRAQTAVLGEEEQKLAAELAAAHERLYQAEGEATALDQQLRQHEKASAARDSQLEGLARDLERAEQHVRVVEAETGQSEQERAELESRLDGLAAELVSAADVQKQVQVSLAAAQSALVEMRQRAEQYSEQLSSARASVAARVERLQAARSEARRTASESEELRSRINRNRLELYESHSRVEQLAASRAEVFAAAMRLRGERTTLDEQINAASEALASARARADELDLMLTDLRQAGSAAHDRRGQIEVEQARTESEAEHLTRTCFAELAMSLEAVVNEQWAVGGGQWAAAVNELADRPQVSEPENDQGAQLNAQQQLPTAHRPLPTDAEAARARLDELRIKLDEMGPVNMMALEELEEAEGRFGFLTAQRRDILDSIRMTEEALAEIKRRSRERFRHAFIHVNQNFQRMFVELFGGGRGEMILIDEDDVLESGIDLIAQPPGKRLQNVLLLSGGEKAMAAIALVLAIFQYRPSPFCILDEVDAPLDEVNVGRFSEKVIEMSRETQFLVITHNKQTMEAARALYGVTMEEPGISKLVSVKFE